MRSLLRSLFVIICLASGASSNAQTKDQTEILKNWSLFSEYQRNGDCASAIPYGREVVKLDPTRFKTLYQKLGECYYTFYEQATDDAKKAYADTLIEIYELGIKYVPDRAATHWLQKAYALENYYENREMEAITAYEKALELDFKGTDFAYGDRLGQLYKKNSESKPELKEKALSLYQRYLDADLSNHSQELIASFSGSGGKNTRPFNAPDEWEIRWDARGDSFQIFLHSSDGELVGVAANQSGSGKGSSYQPKAGRYYLQVNALGDWSVDIVPLPLAAQSKKNAAERMRGLVSDPKELIGIYDKLLATDPENIEYIWNAARVNIVSEQYATAERHLQKLVKKVPANATYWNELAKAQQRQRKFKEAIDSYERALKLNNALKENFLNISVCYREMKNYTQARLYAQRAATSDKGWGRPYIEIAEIYKAAVEDCVRDTKGDDWGKLDINDKLVYKLAQDLYARAKAADPSVANEAERMSRDLSTLIPTREDYFFYRSRIQGNKMEIQGNCYDWIKEAVTVPSL